ncbi:Partner of Y14 and mago [Rhynchospora pubera]|uniref:Partner of Y14 and mago n=1 Tax=Rhynchospora pubera TaxID=906938 RepID=A0AAV8C5H1_9POAL|nr:Partner of Y14 and mago [Rhynchospora pubera]
MSGAPAARADSSGGGGSDQSSSPGRLLSIPKEGERIIAPTRRPDGTYRKAIRIRAGYVPQEEVAIYQSKGTLLKKAQPEGPPGCDPELLVKPKSKSAKRNEKKKEKRQQAALTSSEADVGPSNEVDPNRKDAVDSIAGQIKSMVISGTSSAVDPTIDSADSSIPESGPSDIDKKIRALKKKIRLAEGQLQGDQQNFKPDQLEKAKKIDGWRQELKLLEEKKETLSS